MLWRLLLNSAPVSDRNDRSIYLDSHAAGHRSRRAHFLPPIVRRIGAGAALAGIIAASPTTVEAARAKPRVSSSSSGDLRKGAELAAFSQDDGWTAPHDISSWDEVLPAPAPPGFVLKARVGSMHIPVHPEAGVVKIDFFIAARTVHRWPITGYGNDRGFDPNAELDRSKAVFYLVFTTGLGSIYVSPSCADSSIDPMCTDAYEISGNLNDGTNGILYRETADGSLEIKYSLENSFPSFWFWGLRQLLSKMNESIDGDLLVQPDSVSGWSRPVVTGNKDVFPSFAVYQFPPGQPVRTNCEISESSKGVTALGDPEVPLDGQCRQLSSNGMSLGSR